MISDKQFKKRLKRIKKRGERWKKEYELKMQYVQYLPIRKRRKVSNVMLVIIVTAIIAYTVASFWLQYKTGVAPDSTLTTLFYAFWTSEIVLLTGIKTTKIIKERRNNNETINNCEEEYNHSDVVCE